MAAKATPAQVSDGLSNVASNIGGAADKRAYARWHLNRLYDPAEIEAAYRTSWMARKIHDLPPFDMTREWRDWQAKDNQIEALEGEERRLGIRKKVRDALTWARLWGGAALILGLPGNPDAPAPSTIVTGALKYVHAVTRHQVSVSELDLDVTSEFFGQPKFYTMTGAQNGQVQLHPSRVIPFVGQPIPPGMVGASASLFWGDPLWQIIADAVTDAASTNQGIAAMIQEAKVDTIAIPDLIELVSTKAGEDALLKRINIANTFKSIVNSRVIDADEKWETRQLTFTGLPDVSQQFLQIVAGAADIPVTRMLGTSAKGLNATGEGDLKDYMSMISARQENDLRPSLDRLDAFLVRSALGSYPKDVYWEFAPLDKSDPTALATIEKLRAETVQIYANAGLLPDSALAATTRNQLVESGQWPGLEGALAEAERAGEMAPIEEEEPDPSALTMGPDGNPLPPQPAQQNVAPPLKKAANDAAPRTLYVSRKVVNAAAIIAWAKGQGITTTLAPADMHVTVAYSRTPVDWFKIGEAWGNFGDKKGQTTIAPGGPRMVDKLGDKAAVVLMFASSDLSWRHMAIRDAGASWDFEEYTPHVTLTYQADDIDLSKVEPYRGEIVLGPEVFEELDEDWATKITEE